MKYKILLNVATLPRAWLTKQQYRYVCVFQQADPSGVGLLQREIPSLQSPQMPLFGEFHRPQMKTPSEGQFRTLWILRRHPVVSSNSRGHGFVLWSLDGIE
jgi:hypothetical protein